MVIITALVNNEHRQLLGELDRAFAVLKRTIGLEGCVVAIELKLETDR